MVGTVPMAVVGGEDRRPQSPTANQLAQHMTLAATANLMTRTTPMPPPRASTTRLAAAARAQPRWTARSADSVSTKTPSSRLIVLNARGRGNLVLCTGFCSRRSFCGTRDANALLNRPGLVLYKKPRLW